VSVTQEAARCKEEGANEIKRIKVEARSGAEWRTRRVSGNSARENRRGFRSEEGKREKITTLKVNFHCGFARSTCCRVDGGGVARTSTAGSRARLRSRSYRTPTWRTITRQCGSLTGRGEIAWRSRGDGSALAVQLNNSTRSWLLIGGSCLNGFLILPPCGAGITQAVPGAAVRFSIPARGGGRRPEAHAVADSSGFHK